MINPNLIPQKKLYTGSLIPSIGLGTFGSDSVSAKTISDTVKNAIIGGYRHIDCASVYGNEKEIGEKLTECFNEGIVKREEIWVTSKVWNDKHDCVIESCKQSLSDLQLQYLDLYLVHWPFPNYHPPKCDVTARSANAKPYIHENYMNTWKQMESLVEMGLVKNIGTSNMTIPKLKLVLKDCKIKPSCNEMELHPHFQQPELFNFCIENDIQPIGYSPLGSPGRPERDRTNDDTVDLEDPVIQKISKRLNVSPSDVSLMWAVKRGQIPIPFSVNHYMANLNAIINTQLTNEDIEEISKIDKNCRLIKGQVFLWKDNQSWEDLWDINGNIPT
ncbi:MAG: aldo/keto reductase [Ignavibacteriae bacterium]|nr:aldo/keto reductase [Ignavibacteriota bacterium]